MGLWDHLKSLLKSEKKVNIAVRFELLREAVSGTMSRFYMARDRESGEVVGLKICDPEKVRQFEARFPNLTKPSEGEIALSLKHPRVVETREYGTTAEGEPFIVMEFLEGNGLHALIQLDDPVLDGHRIGLIRQMAEAVQYVHESGYIHRDICPRNFICSRDAASCKLIDFGLTVPATADFMQPGNRTGTPTYMAPEIVRRRPTDIRVDIFSLGVAYYHLCTRKLPWPTPDDPGKAALAAMAHDSVAPRSIFEVQPDLDPTLGETIMQCLAADPNRRPASAKDLLWQVRNVGTSE